MTEHLLKLEISASGSVRRCEPYHPDSTCPACSAATSPKKLFRWVIGVKAHPVASHDETFVQRTCGHCGMQWLEFHTNETKGKK